MRAARGEPQELLDNPTAAMRLYGEGADGVKHGLGCGESAAVVHLPRAVGKEGREGMQAHRLGPPLFRVDYEGVYRVRLAQDHVRREAGCRQANMGRLFRSAVAGIDPEWQFHHGITVFSLGEEPDLEQLLPEREDG